jgi:hypothetical protein
MNRRFITIPLWAILYAGFLLCAYPHPQSGGPQQQKQPKSEPKPEGTSMTGCVDQQDSRYVLVDDRNLAPIANLEADGFPTEAFAKHMGHKVTVRGTASSGGTLPLFKVRSIETISDTCAPKQ